jgi:cytochrome P450
MAAAFYFLARNPAAVEKLREEIKSVGDEDPTWEQLKQMKYLNNVIKESMSIPTPSTESPFHRV